MERSDTISCNQGKCCTWHWHQYQRVSRESQEGGCCLLTGKSRYCWLGTYEHFLHYSCVFILVQKSASYRIRVSLLHTLWCGSVIQLRSRHSVTQTADTTSTVHQLSVVGTASKQWKLKTPSMQRTQLFLLLWSIKFRHKTQAQKLHLCGYCQCHDAVNCGRERRLFVTILYRKNKASSGCQ